MTEQCIPSRTFLQLLFSSLAGQQLAGHLLQVEVVYLLYKEYSFATVGTGSILKGVFGVLFYLLYSRNREILKECSGIVVGVLIR